MSKRILSRNYKKLVFDLLENNLVNGYKDTYQTIFRLFNVYESEKFLNISDSIEYIINDEMMENFELVINKINTSIKPNLYGLENIKSLLQKSINKDVKGFLHINSKGEFKSFKIRKLNPKSLNDFMEIKNNKYYGKTNYKLIRGGGIDYSFLYDVMNIEYPKMSEIDMFFRNQKSILNSLDGWLTMGLKWNNRYERFKELRSKNYNEFLIEMERYLYFGRESIKEKISKGIYGKYWNWNDYENLKIRRKNKHHNKIVNDYYDKMNEIMGV
jgi:hypothetical protein